MSEGLLVALIGAAALIVAAWLGAARHSAGRTHGTPPADVVGRDRIAGDRVGRDQINIDFGDLQPERKSDLVYYTEVVSTFVAILAGCGALFGFIGHAIAQEGGALIGVVVALVIAFLAAGNVTRAKGQ